MSKIIISKQALRITTAIIWGTVLLGVALLTESEQNKALDWELMWVIIGGYLVHSIVLNAFFKNFKSE